MRKRLAFILLLLIVSLIPILAATTHDDRILKVEYTQLTKDARKQVDCLAQNIYYEAGHEPEKGKIAVALVTLNRVEDPRYPKDICSVVKQRVKSTCQFSWFCESGKSIRNNEAYNEAQRIALYVYANYEKLKDFTNGALFYHADYVNPRWKGLEKTAVIGRHIFYREK
jgi:spore germination cell wall hydrolase CwlJ-like protein